MMPIPVLMKRNRFTSLSFIPAPAAVIVLFLILAACSGDRIPVGQPADNEAPTILEVVPADGADNVAADSPVMVIFSERMDTASINENTFYCIREDYSSPLRGTYVVTMDTAMFYPGTMPGGTRVTARVTTGARDEAGNRLSEPKEWHYTTAKGDTLPSDTTPPTVVSVSPANGATGVSNSAVVTVDFSEPVKNVTASTFTVKADGNSVSGNVTLNGLNATFTASNSYPYGAKVTVDLVSGITDTAGNQLTPFSSSFTVEDKPIMPDTTPPEITATDPADGAVNVSANATIYVTFSEPVRNLNGNTVFSYADGNPFYCTFYYSYGDTVASFVPNDPMPYGADVEFVFTSGITDTAGNTMAEYHLNFTVEDVPPSLFHLPDIPEPYGYRMSRLAVDGVGNVYAGGVKHISGTHYDFFIARFLPDGSLAWLLDIPSADNADGVGFADIAVANNVLIVNRYEFIGNDILNYLARYNTENGAMVWESMIPDEGSAIDIYGSYIFGICTNLLYMADISSGSLINSVAIDGAAIDIDVDQDHIYVSTLLFNMGRQNNDYRLLAYNHDLSLAWSADWGSEYDEAPPFVRAANNAVYLVGSGGYVYNSPILLKYGFDGGLVFDSVYVNLSMSSDYPVHGMDTDGENLYMVYGPNKFSSDGKVIYANSTYTTSWGESITFFAGKLYVADETNQLKVYDADTGAQIFP